MTTRDAASSRALSPEDQARIDTLLRAASRAHQSGNTASVQGFLEEILEIDPDHVKATYNLGILHRDRDDIFRAEVYLRRCLKLDPDLIDAYQGLADILFGAKHLLPAAGMYEEALQRAPNRLPLLQNLAKTRMMLKDAAEAERLARKILSIDERSAEAWTTLSWALLYRRGAIEDALQATEEALNLAPAPSLVPALREHALRRAGKIEEADALWAKLLADAPQDWDTTRLLNEAYYWLDQLDRCHEIAGAYVAANPDRAEGVKDLASLTMADGDFETAQGLLERAAALAPENRGIRMVQGLNAFRLGQFDLGLDLYQARWHRSTHDVPWDIPVPEWDGKRINGRLVVYCEQGIGDYAMFALLFPTLREYARSIVIEVNTRIVSLFRRTFPGMRVIDRNALPADWDPSKYEAKVAMGELPRLLGADMENLPNRGGFLIPDSALALKLRNRYRALFPGKRLIGISWRSGNRDSATIRSIDLALLRPLFEIPDCAFISLQYGDNSRDIENLRAETGHVVHWDREVDPMQFLDPFTAQIAAMDLVISVDNSTVHFAGALGKPCWVMLPVNSDWRWLTRRTSSIWYDSLYLWRQQRGEGWAEVVDRVAERLRSIDTDSLIEATADICLRCGEEMLRREAMGPAEEYFRWLLETGRHKAAAFHGVGMSALKAGHAADAAAILDRAAELAPERMEYRADCAVAVFEAGHRDAAERLARDLTRRSSEPTVLMAMGHILAAKGHLDQATDYFARVLRADPGHVVARGILAGLQAAQREDDLARANFARLVQEAPDLPGPRTALAEIDLRQGRRDEAWPNFAWRFGGTPDELPRHLAMIAPDERPKTWAAGKIRRRRVFLRAERSAVEQILFSAVLSAVARDSRSVLAECEPSVLPLLSRAFPNVTFAAAGSLAPSDLIAQKTQIAASLGDLASTYEMSASAWLSPDRGAAAAFRREAINDRAERLIALSWQPVPSPLGGLERFLPILDIPNAKWLLLPPSAVGPDLSRFAAASNGRLIYDAALCQRGIPALADRLAATDLAVAAEDLVGALASALGHPVWRIATASAHWSWLSEGATSDWYPDARVIRNMDLGALRADIDRDAGAAGPSGGTA